MMWIFCDYYGFAAIIPTLDDLRAVAAVADDFDDDLTAEVLVADNVLNHLVGFHD